MSSIAKNEIATTPKAKEAPEAKKVQKVKKTPKGHKICVANELIYKTNFIRENLDRKLLWSLLYLSPWLDEQGMIDEKRVTVMDLYNLIHPGKRPGGHFLKNIDLVLSRLSDTMVSLRILTTNDKLKKVVDKSELYDQDGHKVPAYVKSVPIFEYIYRDKKKKSIVFSINPLIGCLIGKEEMPYTELDLDVLFKAVRSKWTTRLYEWVKIHSQYRPKKTDSEIKKGLINFTFNYSLPVNKKYRDEYPIREFFGIETDEQESSKIYTHPSAVVRGIKEAIDELRDIWPSLQIDYSLLYEHRHFKGILFTLLTDKADNSDDSDKSDKANDSGTPNHDDENDLEELPF